MAACCNNLTLKVENIGDNSEIKNLVGDYNYVFDETRIDEIKNGNFIYKHKASKGFIFRTSNTSWSVSKYFNLYFNRVNILLKWYLKPIIFKTLYLFPDWIHQREIKFIQSINSINQLHKYMSRRLCY